MKAIVKTYKETVIICLTDNDGNFVDAFEVTDIYFETDKDNTIPMPDKPCIVGHSIPGRA